MAIRSSERRFKIVPLDPKFGSSAVSQLPPDGGNGGSRCSERGSFALLFDRVSKIDDRLNNVERSQDIVLSGQSAINEGLIEQRVSLGKIETTLDYIRGDMVRHEKEIDEIEHHTHSLEVASAKADGRRGALSSVVKSAWDSKQYWLLPAIAGLAGYLSKYVGL